MFGSLFKKRNQVPESDTRSSDVNLKAAAQGADFSIRFRSVEVMKRIYGSENESVGKFGMMPDSPGRVVINRSNSNTTISFLRLDELKSMGFIDGDKTLRGAYQYASEPGYESATMELYPWIGKVSYFSITRQQGKLIAFMMFNPDGPDGDYYYTLIFTNPV